MQSFRWPLLFGAVVGVLIFSLYASFAFRGTAAWTIGLVYIGYDSLLLGFMVVSSQIAVMRQERDRKAGPKEKSGPPPNSYCADLCAE